MRSLLLAALLTAAPAARGAIGYSRFAHPRGDYVIEYPADWKRSFGLQTVSLRPAGRKDAKARVAFERYPLGKAAPATPEAFVASLLVKIGESKRLDSQDTVEAAGRKAQRLALSETVELKGRYGQKLPGPMREIYLVLPSREGFYVLRLEGIGGDFDRAVPEFERIAKTLKLRP